MRARILAGATGLAVAMVGAVALAPGGAMAASVAAPAPQHQFPEQVDAVMTRGELEAYMHQRERLGLTNDVVIGVLPDPGGVGPAAAGGAGAQQADEALDRRQRGELPSSSEPPPCPADDADGEGIYLQCEGHEPVTVFRQRDLDGAAPVEQRLGQALRALGEPTPEEQAEGLWSPLSGLRQPISHVRIEGTTAIIGFNASVGDLDLDEAFTGTTLIESLSATAMQFAEVDAVRFELAGSCERFARAIGGAGCPQFARSAVDDEGAPR